MKIAIIGTGAMGMAFGNMLAREGEDVLMISASRKSSVNSINENGITMTDDLGEHHAKVRAALAGTVREKRGLLVLFTKAYGTGEVLEKCAGMIGPDTYIMTLQNGLGNVELAAKYVPKSRIICGVVTTAAETTGPGQVRSRLDRHGQIYMADGNYDPFLEEVSEVFTRSGVTLEINENIEGAIWGKLAINASFNPVTALCRVSQDRLLEVPGAVELITGIMDEVISFASSQGIRVDREKYISRAKTIMSTHKGHYPSMAQDVMRGRPTEIENISGEILRRAHDAGFPMPKTETVYTLMKIMEKGIGTDE